MGVFTPSLGGIRVFLLSMGGEKVEIGLGRIDFSEAGYNYS
jgi:hypothetical protein